MTLKKTHFYDPRFNPLPAKFKTLQDVIKFICSKTNIDPSIIGAKTKKQEIVFTRFLYMKLANEFTSYSLSAIGRAVGLSHSDVIYGIQKVEDDKQLNDFYKSFFN